MARSLTFQLAGAEFTAPMEKLDRSKLYGRSEKKYTDRDGNSCYFGSVSDDGTLIFGREAFEQGYVDEAGHWYERSDLQAVNVDNEILEKVPSSIGQTIELSETVSAEVYLNHIAKSVYQLDCEELLQRVKAEEEIFTFPFNYTASYSPDNAFLIDSDDSLFLVIAELAKFDFIGLQEVSSPYLGEDDEDDDEDDDIDFSMF